MRENSFKRNRRLWQVRIALAGCMALAGGSWCAAAEVTETVPVPWSADLELTGTLQVTLDTPPNPGEIAWSVHSAWRGQLDGNDSASSNVLQFTPDVPLLPGEPVTASVDAPGMTQPHAWAFSATTAGGSGILMTNAQTLALDTGGFAASNIALRMLAAVDMDGDDIVDLMVPYWNSNRVAWLQGHTNGDMTAAMLNAPEGSRLLDVIATDLGHDANPDIFFGAAGGTLLAGYGDGHGDVTNWTTVLPGGTAPYRAVAQGDINGDGWLDLIALAEDVGAGAALQIVLNSNGVLVANAAIPIGGSAYGLAFGDINGDGRPDAVVVGANGFVGAYTNNGQTLVMACETFIDSRHLYACCLLDADGDGMAEIAVAGAEGFLALGALNGNALTFAELEQSVATDTLYGLTAGDLDGDGDTDLLAAGGSRVLSLMNDGTGVFAAQIASELPGESLRDVVLLDGNGDGMLDVAVCGFLSGRVYILWNPDVPTYYGLLENQTVVHATAFNYVFPAGSFSGHVAGALSYELTAAGGGTAPSWLSVDSAEHRIESPSVQMGMYDLELIARDADGREDRADWSLSVVPGLTATAGEHGEIIPSGLVPVAYGSATNFTFVPAEYWYVYEVTTNGMPVEDAESGFTWSNVTANGAIHVTFTPCLAAGGTPHWWLADYGLTNNGHSFDEAELFDYDNDTFDAVAEYIANTDPTNSNDFFLVTQMERTHSVAVVIGSSTARVYSLQSSDNLVDGVWSMVDGQSNIVGNVGGTTVLIDTNNMAAKAYRVKVSLP